MNNNNGEENKTVYKVSEIAGMLRVHEQTVRNLIHNEKLDAIKIGADFRIPVEEYKRFIGENSNTGNANKEETKGAFSVPELAERLSIHEQTVRKMIKDKRIDAVRVGNDFRVLKEDFERFVNRNST